MLIFRVHPCLFASRSLELISAHFLPLILMWYAVRPVQRLSCDRHPDHSHRHHIDSWERSYGFYIFTKSYDSMEFSGEYDQTNSAGARPTGRDLRQQQEWWSQMPLPDDQMQEPDWWNQTHVPSRQVGEQERSEQRPAPADSSEASGQSVQPSLPMPMQLMNTPCHSGVHSESNVPDHLCVWWNDDQQRQYKFNHGTMMTHGTRMGLWHPALDINKNHSSDQWNRWNANDWNQWSSWSARGCDDGWSPRSQWHSEPKKYFDKSPPPEWDGNDREKTWRDHRRTKTVVEHH